MPSPSSKTRDALTKARAEGIDDYLRENDIIDDFDPKKYRQEEKRSRIKDKEEEKRLANKPAAMAAAANELAIESGYSSAAAMEEARLAMEDELKESTRVGGSNKKTKRRKSRMARFLHKKTKKRKSRMRRFPHKRRKSRMRRFPHKRRNSRMR